MDFFTEALKSKKCVLFLGPQFAINQEGQKMHLLLREMLDNAGHELEFGFDNLFILKDSKTAQSPVQSFPLRNAIVNFYEKSEPHPVYHKIAALPFRAIVSCSPDLYLKKILDAKGIGSDFHFYSFNGNTTPSSNNEKSIIFNIFGSISHSQSLIISYDRFYDFIVSIMGEKYTIPAGVREALTDPEAAFVFAGFDLEKWYIPLLIRRLKYPEIDMNQGKTVASALVTADNFRLDQVETDRRFYPIELVLTEQESVSFFEAAYEDFEKHCDDKLNFKVTESFDVSDSIIFKINTLYNENREKEIDQLVNGFIEEQLYQNAADAIRQVLGRNRILKGIDLLGAAQMKKNGKISDDLIMYKGDYHQKSELFMSGEIGIEFFSQATARIRRGLITECDQLTTT